MALEQRQFVNVTDLDTETTHNILTEWLKNRSRQLTEEQHQVVGSLIKKEVRALYLKLLFDKVVQWKSYEKNTFFPSDIRSSINLLFEMLELKHGKLLVQHSLGFLSVSKNGLTEHEMEDLLSLDEKVLSDVFQFHIAPVRRLPSVLWSRIQSDVSEYVVDREADGVKVMAWYHRQFIEAAAERYSTKDSNESDLYNRTIQLWGIMIEYFAGKWSGDIQKPFTYTEYQMQKLQLVDANFFSKKICSKPANSVSH